MGRDSLGLTPELHEYVVAHSMPPDEIARALAEETRRTLPDRAEMQVAPEQAALLTMLARLVNARQAVEVGTFTGMSALAIARGLAPGGRLMCFDVSDEYTAVARRYWERAGVADRISLHIGPAADLLRGLPNLPYLDLVFIDADKHNYPVYWSELVPRLRPGGLAVVDNVLWSGRVLDPDPDENTAAIVAFNDLVAGDNRVEAVVLPIADGVTLARRR
jgi:caffeoyl-CoA O-methyltransferase